MKRITKLAGLPVVMEKTGKQIGRVHGVCLCADGQNVEGVLISLFGFGNKTRFVERGNILVFGEVSLLIKGHVQRPGALRSEAPPNLEVLSIEGKKIGWMTDALVDESDGRVRAVEISYGYFDDFTRGRQWLQDFALRPCGVIAVLRESGAQNPG